MFLFHIIVPKGFSSCNHLWWTGVEECGEVILSNLKSFLRFCLFSLLIFVLLVIISSMSSFSLFDIAGPVMVGPSSSHTAGAAKIGQFARAIYDTTPTKVHFLLHGSFGEVYKGHATDRALLGGVMKMPPNDPGIRDAFNIAEKAELAYEFEPGDLGHGFHPNTVKITLENEKRKVVIIGSSIGGGNVEINRINGFDIHLTGNSAEQFFTLVVENENLPGMLAKTTSFLGEKGIRIVNMQSSFLAGENKVLSVLSLEKALSLKEILALESEEGIIFVRSLKKLTQ